MKKLIHVKEKFTEENCELLENELKNTRLHYEIDKQYNVLIVYGDANDIRIATHCLKKSDFSVL